MQICGWGGGQELTESRITCMDILAHWTKNCNLLLIRDLQVFNYLLQRIIMFITKQALTEILKFLILFIFYGLVAFIIWKKNIDDKSNVNLIPTISDSDTKCISYILFVICNLQMFSHVFSLLSCSQYSCKLSFVSVN